MRLKSLMISKSSFNPGFSTFMQNLMFNDNAESDTDFSLLSFLLSKKANPNIKDRDDRTPVFYLFIIVHK